MNKKQKQHQTTVPGKPLAVNVVGNQREDLGFALKSFKRKIKASGILEKIKDRKEFIKPSVVKRRQTQKAQFIQKIKDRNDF
jgi:small subunit ribosomal protein S21